MVAEIAEETGAAVDVPDDFYSLVAKRHDTPEAVAAAEESENERFEDLPETEKLYYDDQERTQFEAVVLDVFEREGRVRRRPRSDDVLPRGRRPACGHGNAFD